MNTTSSTPSMQSIPATPRTHSVAMSSSNYLSTLLRLVAMELYKLQRRKLSKALVAIVIGGIILLFSLLGIQTSINRNKPLTDFGSPVCSQPSQSQACVTQAQLIQNKQQVVHANAELLSLPNSMVIISFVAITIGMLAIPMIMLAGTLAGEEYSIGTIRLMFTRGPARIHFLLAKVLTIIICVIIGLLALNLVGVLTGYALYPLSGLTPGFQFLTTIWAEHALLYLLIEILACSAYAMVALFFATLGRSTVTGIVGGVIWLFTEGILTRILTSIISLTDSNPIAKFFRSIPNYFISNNVISLQQHVTDALKLDTSVIGGLKVTASTLSNQHTLLVLGAYIVICIGLSCWLVVKRDVTN